MSVKMNRYETSWTRNYTGAVVKRKLYKISYCSGIAVEPRTLKGIET